jgi:hypothetical protein
MIQHLWFVVQDLEGHRTTYRESHHVCRASRDSFANELNHPSAGIFESEWTGSSTLPAFR